VTALQCEPVDHLVDPRTSGRARYAAARCALRKLGGAPHAISLCSAGRLSVVDDPVRIPSAKPAATAASICIATASSSTAAGCREHAVDRSGGEPGVSLTAGQFVPPLRHCVLQSGRADDEQRIARVSPASLGIGSG
jgi:hypothetical protein